jgi:hypothetical protein
MATDSVHLLQNSSGRNTSNDNGSSGYNLPNDDDWVHMHKDTTISGDDLTKTTGDTQTADT